MACKDEVESTVERTSQCSLQTLMYSSWPFGEVQMEQVVGRKHGLHVYLPDWLPVPARVTCWGGGRERGPGELQRTGWLTGRAKDRGCGSQATRRDGSIETRDSSLLCLGLFRRVGWQ